MRELIIENKQEYFDKNYPFYEKPLLTDKRKCIHCEKIFVVGEYKVFKNKVDFEFICCPYAPDCDGTVIDWFII